MSRKPLYGPCHVPEIVVNGRFMKVHFVLIPAQGTEFDVVK